MSWFKVVRLLATPAPRFAPLATPAPRTYAAQHFPPPLCWSNPAHVPPHPGCACGYHGFVDRLDAVRYAELFSWPRAVFPPHRFLLSCAMCDEQPTGLDDSSVRAGALRAETVILPPYCSCGRRARGVRPRAPEAFSEPVDHASPYPLLVGACTTHLDRAATEQLHAFVETVPYA